MLKSYLEYLQNVLGNKYIVVDEEKIDADYDKNKNLVIVSEFSGTNYKTSIVFTLQFTCFTNNVKETMQELRDFSWKYNDERLSTNIFPYIRQLITQPNNNSNFSQLKDEYIGTIAMTISLICSIQLTDIEHVIIDNEIIDPNTVSITYQAIPDTQRDNDEELNSTNINEASLNIQVSFPADKTHLYRTVRNIMFGIIAKNKTFDLKVKFTDDLEYTTTIKLINTAINTERSSLTIASATFTH